MALKRYRVNAKFYVWAEEQETAKDVVCDLMDRGQRLVRTERGFRVTSEILSVKELKR